MASTLLAVSLLGTTSITVGRTSLLPHDRTVTEAGAPEARGGESRTRAPASVTGLYRGKPARYWAARFRERTRQLQAARRTLFTNGTVKEAINLAATVYGHASLLWSLARCETGGTFSPTSRNLTAVGSEHASGLMQFLPSTFASTPYGRFSIWSPYANALAGGWMLAHGRRSEWAC